jgi:hypothetical protein
VGWDIHSDYRLVIAYSKGRDYETLALLNLSGYCGDCSIGCKEIRTGFEEVNENVL